MPTKKTTKKATASKVIQEEQVSTYSPATEENISFIQSKKKQILIGVAAVALLAGLYYFKGWFVAATVNGQPISRLEVIQELEQQGGKQTMGSIITKTLILQEAKKQNVTVSQEEINAEIKKTEDQLAQQGQKLDEVLLASGLSREGLEEQVKLNKLIEKLIGKDITVSDKEVQDYLEANKDAIPQNASSEELQKTVKEQLRQQKLSTKFQSWITELQNKANITYFVQY